MNVIFLRKKKKNLSVNYLERNIIYIFFYFIKTIVSKMPKTKPLYMENHGKIWIVSCFALFNMAGTYYNLQSLLITS